MEAALSTAVLQHFTVVMSGKDANTSEYQLSIGLASAKFGRQQNWSPLVRLQFNSKLQSGAAADKAAIGI